MTRIAQADDKVSSSEKLAIQVALTKGWSLGPKEAEFLVHVALQEITPDVDYYRLTRNFYGHTTEDERRRFIDVLFAVGAADGMVTQDEMREIHDISKSLKVSQRDYVLAKGKIASANREN